VPAKNIYLIKENKLNIDIEKDDMITKESKIVMLNMLTEFTPKDLEISNLVEVYKKIVSDPKANVDVCPADLKMVL